MTPLRWLGLVLLSLALSSYTIDVECLTQQGHCHNYLFSQQYSDCVSPLVAVRPVGAAPLPVVLVPFNPPILAPLGPELEPLPLSPGWACPLPWVSTAYRHLRGPPLSS